MDIEKNKGINKEGQNMSLILNEDDVSNLGQGQQCFVMVDQDSVEPIHSISSTSQQEVTTFMSRNQLQTDDTDPLNCDNNDDEDDLDVEILNQPNETDIQLQRKRLFDENQTEVTKDTLIEDIDISDQKKGELRKILPKQIYPTDKIMSATKPACLINTPIVISTSLSTNIVHKELCSENEIADSIDIGMQKSALSAVAKSFTIKTLKQSSNHTGTNIVLSGKKPIISETQFNMPVGTQNLEIEKHIEEIEDFDKNESTNIEKNHINFRRNINVKTNYGSIKEMSDEGESDKGKEDYEDEDYERETDEEESEIGESEVGESDEGESDEGDEDGGDVDVSNEHEGDEGTDEESGNDEDGDDTGEFDEGGGKHEVSKTECCQVHAKKKKESLQVYHCPACGETFPNFPRLEKHAKDQHDVTSFEFPCDMCGQNFTRPDNLNRHKATKHRDGKKPFECEQCHQRFIRKDALLQHISVHVKQHVNKEHLNNDLADHLKNTVAENFSNRLFCSSCNRSFADASELSKHTMDDVTCIDCKVTFECKTLFRFHINREHHNSSCSECGKEFTSRQKLYLHKLSHSPKFVCEICKKGFLWKCTYNDHMAYHTGERPELCDVCGKSYPHKAALSNHRRQDHNKDNRKDICLTCGKSFACKAKLVEHSRSHTGEKPFLCDHCSAAFATKYNLISHIKTVHGIDIKSNRLTKARVNKAKTQEKSTTASDMNLLIQPTHIEENVQDLSNKETVETHQLHEKVHEQVAAVYEMLYNYP